MASPVLAHRLLIAPEAPGASAAEVIDDAIAGTRAL
jgi:hypothetical protein